MAAATEPPAERLVVRLGHPEQIADHQQRVRPGVVGDELARAPVDDLVDLAIGELPHEVLVFLQPFRREQPHEERPVLRVLRRVEGDQLVAEGQPVSVLFDEVAHIVAFEGDGKAGKGPVTDVADENVSVPW